ncbi:Cof-type HAD-IIB family hydrolase [Bifidobacterium gallicum]|nr:Cof-type HAD-IIB family hydrolase [Bifidobacterium gallicum]
MQQRAANIKAAFFDIDGTLTSFTTHEVPQSTVRTLHALQDHGIAIYICTGRAPSFLNVVLERIPVTFNGIIGLNGQYCVDGGELIREQPLAQDDIDIMMEWFADHPDVVASFAEKDYVYFNQMDDTMRQSWKALGKTAPAVHIADPVTRTATTDTFQISPYISTEQEQALTQLCHNVRGVRWAPTFADLIPADGGKHRGIQAVMNHHGWTMDEAIAFGDGGNDIDMLQAAGIGVAMGNAADDVKTHADFVTRSVDQDGIAYACQQLGVLGD